MWKCQSTAVVKTALARLRWSFSGVHAFTGGRWREEGGGKDEFKKRTSSWLICRHSNANHFGTNPVEPIDPSHLCLKHAEWTLIFNQGMHTSAAYVLGEWANYLSASSRIRGIFFYKQSDCWQICPIISMETKCFNTEENDLIRWINHLQ